jgi:hypothetical protein
MSDAVDHPSHYQSVAGIEAIDVIAAFMDPAPFCLGNTVKYVLRAGKKAGNSALQDLKKARWYLDWIIKEMEKPTP